MWQAKILTPGSAVFSKEPRPQVRKDLSGLLLSPLASFPPFSTATTSFCLPPLSCLAPHTACHIHVPSPALPFYLSCWQDSWTFPPPSPPTRLALVLSAFESRNFSPPHCLTPMNITKSARDRLLALLFRCLALPWAVKVCSWNCKGSPAWAVVGTCSGRMKTSGVQLLKWKESHSYPLSMSKFSFLKAHNIARFGQVFRRAKGISPMEGNPLQGRVMPKLFKGKVTIAF